tara:strand:- start:181 stop:393 length:213 start_codon:yes stop_codon:yes gene_type:complete
MSEDNKVPELTQLTEDQLVRARLMFQTVAESLNQMEFPVDGKEQYLKEIQAEVDKIDVEVLSRGLIGGDE